MRRSSRLLAAGIAVATFAAPLVAETEDITAYVLEIDRPARCLDVDWDNDTRKRVCWSETTKFTVLERDAAATSDEIRVGSYLHVVGDRRDGVLRATSIEIWESAAKPEG
jgi:hypothetical protein